MSAEISPNMLSQGKSPSNDELMTLRKIITLIVSNKLFFIVGMILALLIAYLFNKYTIPTYKVSATLLIEDEKRSSSTGNDQLLEGFGLMAGMKNLDNQIMILSSRTLVNRTLNELPLDLEYYYRGLIKKKSTYPFQPIRVVFENNTTVPEGVEFRFKYLGKERFSLDVGSDDSFSLHTKASFGEKIKYQGGFFTVERKDLGSLPEDGKKKLYFIFHSRREHVQDYIKRIMIDPAAKKGSIVRISIEGTNKEEDLLFLNKLTDIFLNISLDKKNNEAIRTIQFIDDQLVGISDSLLITENKLQQFRSRNMVMNLSAQGQAIINQSMSLENEKARLAIEASYYDYLADYLAKDVVGEVPTSPATMGITDPGLTKLVAELADLQGQFYSKSLGERNPLQTQLAQRVRNVKDALKETLNGVRKANSMAMQKNQDQIKAVNDQASVLPKTERNLLGIERKYKLNDELYTFLLEKRAIAQMQKASNVADNELIDYPESENKPVRPKKALIYLLAIFTGTGVPFLWILLIDMFNVRIREFEEVKKITDIPVTGAIPFSLQKKTTLVLDEPDCPVAEAFRLLRSRMQFFTKEIKSPVILITSSMPKEGKTFTAINLASAYSLMGKKTVLVGFDLRQPKIFSDFNLKNDHGVTTWLIGNDELEDIIKETSYENLSIIASGPTPPNPAELTSSEKTGELFKILKKKFEYIIIDSSPVGTVSDTFHLASIADTCIMVVRQNLTFKDLLTNTIKDLKISNLKSLCLVINGITSDDRHYGYGGLYRYENAKRRDQVEKEKSNFLSHLNEFIRNLNRTFFKLKIKTK